MMRSAIRQLAAARNVALVSAAFDETTVQLWDIARRQQIGEFQARFAFGANNLALHPDGGRIATGISSGRGTIASYEGPDGVMVWQRGRISYPARLRFSPSGHHISCTIDNRKVELIDAKTGVTNVVHDGVRNYFEGDFGQRLIVPTSGAGYVLRADAELSENEFRIDKLTFAPLDAAFGPDRLYLTESGGPVRCIDCLTGEERWRFDPPPESHILRLHYSPEDDFTYGVLWHYEKGLFRYLLRFDRVDGCATQMCTLDSSEEAFVAVSHQLITSSGNIIDLSNGQTVGSLPFPQKEYPD